MKLHHVLPAFLFVLACQSAPKAPCPDTQEVVDRIAAANPDVVRLTVHAVPPEGGAMCAVASTADDKRGKASDPEDHQALANGETVVLDEASGIDVSVPVLQQGGKFTAVVGVTMKSGQDRAAIVQKAKSIASEVAGAMPARKM